MEIISLTSFILVLIIISLVIPKLKKSKFVGRDMNKFDKRKVVELGGIFVFISFLIALIIGVIFNFNETNLVLFFGAILTLCLIEIIGIIDDTTGWKKGIKQWQHAIIPFFLGFVFSFILFILNFDTIIFVPLIGGINFSLIYFILVPFGITCATNAYNMLAGFNGLEAGQGIIIIGTLTIISLMQGSIEGVIIGFALIGGLIGFLVYNWYPAKIFGGDSLTLLIGGAIAVISILAKIEVIGIILMTLFIIEFFIKAKHKMKSECFGTPTKEGYLKHNPCGGSLTHFIMKIGKDKLKEWQVTLIILFIQLIIAIIGFNVYIMFW